MCISTDTTRLILRLASTQREVDFVWMVIDSYFARIVEASEQKLVSYGMRPFVTPVAAEFALKRVENSADFPEFVSRLIAGDALVADLAIRAITFYANRFAAMENEAIGAELGTRPTFDMQASAHVIQRNMKFIQD